MWKNGSTIKIFCHKLEYFDISTLSAKKGRVIKHQLRYFDICTQSGENDSMIILIYVIN